MSNKSAPSEDDVGYGKPPRHSRFQKGQSGNPKGRPSALHNMVNSLQDAMNEQVVIKENGRRRTISKMDAATKQLVNKAAGGDIRAFNTLMTFATLISSGDAATVDVLTGGDNKIIERMLARVTGTPDEPTDISEGLSEAEPLDEPGESK